MAEYLAPGVYVEEVSAGPKPIEGVSTSTTGFVGSTERGPTEARLVTSFPEFQRCYGGAAAGSFLTSSVQGYFANGGKRCYVARVVGRNARTSGLDLKAASGSFAARPTRARKPPSEEGEAAEPLPQRTEAPSSLHIEAIGPGAWGDRVAVMVGPASSERADLFRLRLAYWSGAPPEVPIADPTDFRARRDPKWREPAAIEEYDNLSMDPASTSFVQARLNASSALVRVTAASTERPGDDNWQLLQGGSDHDLSLEDYRGAATIGQRTGLAALADVDEISIVCAPDHNDVVGLDAVLVQEHCELLKDRFAILSAPRGAAPESLRPPLDSSFAAYYYPWVRPAGAGPSTPSLVPPIGHVAGIFARSDTERGVHKAPANEVVRGVAGLEFPIAQGDQEILNPRAVNCIRGFTGRGIRLWGARTMSSDPQLKYVNVRRLLLFLEESIHESTQWAVFEPNDASLWVRVRQTVGDFLTRVWRDGALMGHSADQAFFVRCDETTMTQDDIANGRLIVLVGVAPVKPAEFVIFRISQYRSEN